MAIDYTLELEANIQPEVLLKRINQISGIPFINDEILRDEVSLLTINAYLQDDETCIKLIEDAYGFRPFVALNMRHGKTEPARNDILMMSIVASALKELEGDMVLEWQSEIVVLQKIDGNITFNSDWNELSGISQLDDAGLVYGVVQMPPKWE